MHFHDCFQLMTSLVECVISTLILMLVECAVIVMTTYYAHVMVMTITYYASVVCDGDDHYQYASVVDPA